MSDFFTVGPVTLAFPSFFTKSAPRGTNAEPKYNTTVIITPEQYRDVIYPKVVELAASAFKNGETSNPKFNWPFLECKFKSDTYPEAAKRGMLYGNLKTQFEVQVVDANRQPIINPGLIRDGSQAYISMNLYSYSKGGGVGIAAGLGPVMVVGDGEVLNVGGGVSVDSAFAGIQVNPTTAPGIPTAGVVPAGVPPMPPLPR